MNRVCRSCGENMPPTTRTICEACDGMEIPPNRLINVRRRALRAMEPWVNTCPASRHLLIMADALASGKAYPMLEEDPQHCALTMYSVLESLWKARKMK